jgi:hypothetical protein
MTRAEAGSDLSRAAWRKSRRSSSSGACVEVAPVARAIAVRDSTDADGPELAFRPAAWRRFLTQVKAAAYDLQRSG